MTSPIVGSETCSNQLMMRQNLEINLASLHRDNLIVSHSHHHPRKFLKGRKYFLDKV